MRKQLFIVAVSLLGIFGLSGLGALHGIADTEVIAWSKNAVDWNDFQPVDYILDDFDASIYSTISAPNRFTEDKFSIYAYMDPKLSQKVSDSVGDAQLLIHEQYHFNITEYVTRLLRKEVAEIGEKNISAAQLRDLKVSYLELLEDLQGQYDTESDHNKNYEKQRYWELKVDDWLRQTDYFSNEDITSYSIYNEPKTGFYRIVYQAYNQDLLLSYPLNKAEANIGEAYKVLKDGDITKISSYKDGALTSGGTFETENVLIDRSQKGSIFIKYYDAQMKLKETNGSAITLITTIDKASKEIIYFNSDSVRVNKYGFFKKQWKRQNRTVWTSSTYDENGNPTANEDGIFTATHEYDDKYRLTTRRVFGAQGNPILDEDFVHEHVFKYDIYNNVIGYQAFGTDRKYATGIGAFNKTFEYNSRGQLSKEINFNLNSTLRNDSSGAAISTYSYDRFGNICSIKFFNTNEKPTINEDDVHQLVNDYDDQGRLIFEASYYPENVLWFNDLKQGAYRYDYVQDSLVYKNNTEAYKTHFPDDEGVMMIAQTMSKEGFLLNERFYKDSIHFAVKHTNTSQFDYIYNPEGQVLMKTSKDSLGNITAFDNEVAIVKYTYDSNGNMLTEEYLDSNNQPVLTSNAIAKTTYKYEANNFITEIANFGKALEPTNYFGTHRTTYVVNRFGKDSLEYRYNKSNRLKAGVSIVKTTYNIYGELASQSYFNANNQPTLDEQGVHKMTYHYNDYSKYSGYRVFGKHNQPINNTAGVHHWVQRISEKGLFKSEAYFNKDEKPVIGPEGFHEKVYYRDSSDFLTRISFLDTEKNAINDAFGVSDYMQQLFPSGRIKRYSYYNSNAELVEDSEGVAEYLYSESLNGLYYLDEMIDANGDSIKTDESETIN